MFGTSNSFRLSQISLQLLLQIERSRLLLDGRDLFHDPVRFCNCLRLLASELRCGGEVVPPDLPVLPPEPVPDRFREIWGTRHGYREPEPVPAREGSRA